MYTLSKIIELMNKNNLGNQELASALGLNRQLITDWKAGRSKSYKKYLPQIAEFFGVTVDYLLGKSGSLSPEREEQGEEIILSDRDRELLNVFHSFPEEKQLAILEMLRKLL